MENRWNMLDSYSEGQEIFGRDEEIAQISESIVDNIQTFVYGKSGIGKTSLIQAGVFPKLRKRNFFPVIIRLAFFENEDLKKVVIRLVQEEASREDLSINKEVINYKSIDESDLSECSLYEYFSKTSFTDTDGNQQIPVLIFDQFEETINNEDNWQRTVDFLKDELYNLLDDSIAIRGRYLDYTNFRIVISMREDYLYCLEDIVDQFCLWELRYNRFRVKSLSEERAYEVISRTCGEDELEINHRDKIIRTIIKIVKINSGSRFTEINTALLSLICSLLSENAADGCIKYQDLRNINSYLSSYYDNICEVVGSKAVRYLENRLITKDGRRSSVDEAEALSSNKITQSKLDYLVDRKLLRRIKTDATSTRYEYIHDLFAKMVFKRRAEKIQFALLPDYRNISKKLSILNFIKRFVVTSFVIMLVMAMYVLLLVFTGNGFSAYGVHTIVVYSLLLYWAPLFVQRYHDSHHSGWLLLLFPLATIFIFIEHFIPAFSGVSSVVHIIGYAVALYALSIFFFPSKQGDYMRKSSLLYESLSRISPATNVEYIKGISLECLWMVCAVFFRLVLNNWYEGVLNWNFFSERMTFFSLSIHPFIWPLLIGLCLSRALPSRLKQIGYYPELAYIPLLNIFLAVLGLVPDGWLIKVGLMKIRVANNQEDDIFTTINDEFRSMGYANNGGLKRKRVLMCLLVPFYFVGIALNKKAKIGDRIGSIGMGFLSLYLVSAFCIAWSDFFSSIDTVLLIAGGLLLILSIVCCCYLFFFLMPKKRQAILSIIESHPEYTISEIAVHLALSYKEVERIINKYVKKGEILRTETNGIVLWQVNKNHDNMR